MGTLTRKMTDLNPDTPFADDLERVQTLYFNWLCSLVHLDFYRGKKYLCLAKRLHDKEFYWTVDMDENRANDGKKLRNVWFETLDHEAEHLGVGTPILPRDGLDGPCTVLEMMVALAIRCESDIMQDDDLGNRTYLWFWEMIQNLGLFGFSDDRFDEVAWSQLDWVIGRMLDRLYTPDDWVGCLWPIPGSDFREVEVWQQMNWYINWRHWA